ncbi:MAG: hypothetical protein COU69_01775 [Candidatus Pacebacteria bacterium CG10_big_fil_rev_8_21_14_0_10_56_10]|nr:MAG: hypothetical protein COU69_01775 [Candidatus Pacebacteria bacterium CG10_big_fil_rev_8_21_14_0_10_56_10]
MTKSFSLSCLVLSRISVGETDQVVTTLSALRGKLRVVAKGSRQLHSTKRAALEPGNIVTAHCINTASMPLLTQARLTSSARQAATSLARLRRFHQLLEIVDRLFVEEELEAELYEFVLSIRRQLLEPAGRHHQARRQLEELVVRLGYPSLAQTSHRNVNEYVSQLTGRGLHSFEYLLVK